MGAALAKAIWELLGFGTVQSKLLMLGLEAAGKSTVLNKLGEVIVVIPMIGFNVETVKYGRCKFTMWDIGVQDQFRPLWRHYFQGTNGLVFVVDSNDRERINEAAEELHKLLGEDELRNATLLVFANKQDLPQAMSVAEVADKLKLHSIRRHKWYVQATSAVTGEGLYEGLDWLSKTLTAADSRTIA